MNYPIYEINGVKTYRTPQHLRTLRDVSCRACAKPVSVKTLTCESCGYQFPTEENSAESAEILKKIIGETK